MVDTTQAAAWLETFGTFDFPVVVVDSTGLVMAASPEARAWCGALEHGRGRARLQALLADPVAPFAAWLEAARDGVAVRLREQPQQGEVQARAHLLPGAAGDSRLWVVTLRGAGAQADAAEAYRLLRRIQAVPAEAWQRESPAAGARDDQRAAPLTSALLGATLEALGADIAVLYERAPDGTLRPTATAGGPEGAAPGLLQATAEAAADLDYGRGEPAEAVARGEACALRPADLWEPGLRALTDAAGGPIEMVWVHGLPHGAAAVTLFAGPARSERLGFAGEAYGQIVQGRALAARLFASDTADDEEAAAEAAAGLAGELAHELRQPATVVNNLVTTLLDLLEAGRGERVTARLQEYRTRLGRNLGRMNRVLEGLRLVGRRQAPRCRLVPLEGFLAAVRRADGLPVAPGTSVRWERPPRSTPLWVDAEQVGRALLHLVDHAREAAAGREDGWVAVRAELADGGVALVVEDNGKDAGTRLPHDGRAFYTNRTESDSFGLLVADSVARAHGGRLRVERRPGGGSRAALWLPVAEVVPGPAAPEPVGAGAPAAGRAAG